MDQMDKESANQTSEASVTPAPPTGAAPTAAAVPAKAASSAPLRLDDVVRQVKAELVGAQDRGSEFNPYDCRLGNPNRDVWGKRRRA
jgi:hypothetical protein